MRKLLTLVLSLALLASTSLAKKSSGGHSKSGKGHSKSSKGSSKH